MLPDVGIHLPNADNPEIDPRATLSEYLMSIVYMPHSMRMVCLTNLFCWMAHVCYSLYFTDFVGEAVYGGDPKVPFIFSQFLQSVYIPKKLLSWR